MLWSLSLICLGKFSAAFLQVLSVSPAPLSSRGSSHVSVRRLDTPTALGRTPRRLPILFSLCVSVWVISAESPLAERGLPVSRSEAFSIPGRLVLSVPVPFFPLSPSLSTAVRYPEQTAVAGPRSVQFPSRGVCVRSFKDVPVTDRDGAVARVALMKQV